MIYFTELDFLETANHDINNDIVVQVPFSEKIIIEHSNFDEELKRSLL